MRCLVLGAGGFLGQALVAALQRQEARVAGFGRAPAVARPAGVAWTPAAFADVGALAAAVAGQEIVFHLLGSSLPETSNHDPAADLHDEVVPAVRLLDLCRGAGVRKVVFASSGGTVYGIPSGIPTQEGALTAPISAYGIGKLTVERYLALYRHLHGLDYQVLRVANPYGPGQSPFRRQGIVAAMVYRALRGEAVEMWGTGEVVRDFIHVDDVAAAFVAGAWYAGGRRVMNVGSGQGRSLNEVAGDVAKAAGQPTLRIDRRPGRQADVPASVLDTALIRAETGWRPAIPWLAGLSQTAAWIKDTYG